MARRYVGGRTASAHAIAVAGPSPRDRETRSTKRVHPARPYARAVPADRDKQIDQLYSVPLDEFVERRNEFARSLRKDANRQAADEVRKLRKPTLPAWTVNQLARREKMRLRGLLTAGERLRKAHEELLVGGSPEALQQGRDGERRAIAELVGAAELLLKEAGHPASEATLERVRDTLHAAVVDEGIGRRVREGRLGKEEQMTGFGFGNLPTTLAAERAAQAKPAAQTKPATRGQKREATKKDEAAREKRAQARKAREIEAAQEKHRQAEESLRDVRRAVKDAERAVKNQTRELERAERILSSRQADVANAEREVVRARRSLER
jgi:hypothetical protein